MRVRFAPSPTGALHIGGARTALYNWLLARQQDGVFLLRIEDTDRERSTPENVEQILDALRWLELDWIQDFVIARSDGSPLYNLAVAVDDLDMGITHVVRGADHLSNTPRQVMILRALGAEPPVYAHLPLLHGPDGAKLSKRHGAASVQELREAGYLPEAVRNYIPLLGWGLDETTTFLTTDELIRNFSLERVSRNPAVFDEQKLRWMNGRYMRELGQDELRRRLEEVYGRAVPPEAVEISQEKMQTLADFWELAGFLVERREIHPQAWGAGVSDR